MEHLHLSSGGPIYQVFYYLEGLLQGASVRLFRMGSAGSIYEADSGKDVDVPSTCIEGNDHGSNLGPSDTESCDDETALEGSQIEESIYHTILMEKQIFHVDCRYSNLTPLGKGVYGVVVKAYDSKYEKYVAIKKIADVFNDVVDAKRVLREIKILRHLKGHENIIGIQDIMAVPTRTLENFKDLYIVTDLYETDIENVIQSKQMLTEQHIRFFLYQLLRALKFMHSANIVHRDLKPSNILANANCNVAICDFGLARGIDDTQDYNLTEHVVTRWYRAPELLCNCMYGKPVDVWSAGCIFAELITGHALFRGNSPNDQLRLIIKKLGCPPVEKLQFITSQTALVAILETAAFPNASTFADYFPASTNPLAINLLRQMLAFNPADRITAEDALNHSYFCEYRGVSSEPAAQNKFDYSFEKSADGSWDMKELEVRSCMWEEVNVYRNG